MLSQFTFVWAIRCSAPPCSVSTWASWRGAVCGFETRAYALYSPCTADHTITKDPTVSRMIFINVPITNLERSRRFSETIGTRQEPKLSNEQGAIMHFSNQIAVMLLTDDFQWTCTSEPIGDAPPDQ